MALIEGFAEATTEQSRRRHKPVRCTYAVVEGKEGVLVQFDTYGTDGRKIRGKTSQSVQLDEISAGEMVKILLNAFPRLRK